MHGYGMLGDVFYLLLYLVSIGCWGWLWLVCLFSTKDRLNAFLGPRTLLICAVVFPLLAAAFVAGAFYLLGIAGIALGLCLAGIALPLASLRLLESPVR